MSSAEHVAHWKRVLWISDLQLTHAADVQNFFVDTVAALLTSVYTASGKHPSHMEWDKRLFDAWLASDERKRLCRYTMNPQLDPEAPPDAKPADPIEEAACLFGVRWFATVDLPEGPRVHMAACGRTSRLFRFRLRLFLDSVGSAHGRAFHEVRPAAVS